ncbi:MAG TPA: Gfo/Idh/MocA family oxidoreductase [Vicinamibacterales bacterium]|nr:Gfo/Idh/MocA family oxidoreductase [Vicinamibacterales bacterium]
MASIPDEAGAARASGLSRRRFLSNVGTAALAFSIVRPEAVRGSTANSKVRLGVIGCGARGRWIAGLFRKHGGYEVAALADYFQDRVDEAGTALGVPPENRFTGLSGYRRLLERRLVDAVAIESPPFFHPQQAADAVDAGVHVFLAKPIAVDVPGCRTIEQSAAKATANRLCFIVDFQTRANELFIEAIRRVHDGALGRFAFGEATCHAEDPWAGQHEFARSNTPEGRLRGWGLSRELSGDIITEQNIHTIDVASWILRQPPVAAYGTGGRKYRDVGSCWDTFTVTFVYPDNVGIAFSSRQFNGYGTRPEGIRNRMFGSDGVLETEYGGQVLLRGKHFYRGGETSNIYEQGAVNNIATFHDSIQRGDYSQPTVAESVRSNLVTILGRTAAYEGRVATWDEVLRSDERMQPDLTGLRD